MIIIRQKILHFAKSNVDLRINKSNFDFELKNNIEKYNYYKKLKKIVIAS
jgi:hypothetical protein